MIDDFTKDAQASGYNTAFYWCLRCDVGWGANVRALPVCWLCEQRDRVYRYTLSPTFRFAPVEEAKQ